MDYQDYVLLFTHMQSTVGKLDYEFLKKMEQLQEYCP